MKNFLLILSVIGLSGCISIPRMPHHRPQVTYTQQIGIPVTIVSIKNVDARGETTGVGGLAGAAIGGLAASDIGSGTTSAIFSVIGLLAGGVTGNLLEQQMNSLVALQIVVKDDHGGKRVVIQPDDCGCYKKGGRGYLINDRVIME